MVFASAEVVASLRVFIDFTLLTYTVADILIITAPTLALYGVLWHLTPERQYPVVKYICVGSAVALLALSPYLMLSQLFTSLVVATLFAATAFHLSKARVLTNIYILILTSLFVLHSVLMLGQAAYMSSILSLPISDKSNHILEIILVIHLVLTTCTALVFPMLYFTRSEAHLINLANFDALTNLYNRRAFFTFGEQRIKECIDKQQPIAVMMIDVDYFKRVNDQFGHDAGDAALKWIGKKIGDHIRSSDVAARIGGEEFALILANTDHETAIKVGQRLRASVFESNFRWHDKAIPLSISIGVNCQPLACKDIKHMLMQADKGLYIAKNSGRNQLVENDDTLVGAALS
ncbi:GGDEF domain-containing protein [Pseudoalteromonas sp. YIC-656]|uniref:GGDEF domain-containing protein n=1 Tax=Pseudoalteromonas pernae TaxID=3118054 RepID=UPI003242E47A